MVSLTGPAWLAPTLAVLRGQIPDKPRATSGVSGTTHCGRWWSVPWAARQRYGWVTRLVCIRAEIELAKARLRRKEIERVKAYFRAKELEQSLQVTQARIDELLALVAAGLAEPPGVDGCSKVRFHHQKNAEDWAARIGRRTGEGVEAYRAYPCKDCPRSPVTMRRYWHAGHSEAGQSMIAKAAFIERRRETEHAARRDGNLLSQRLDPAVLAGLRKLRDQGKGQEQ